MWTARIHPARFEEMVEKAQREVESNMREDGEAATLEVGTPRHSSRACEASWQDEVQNQLWSECTEAFHGGCAAGRPSGI